MTDGSSPLVIKGKALAAPVNAAARLDAGGRAIFNKVCPAFLALGGHADQMRHLAALFADQAATILRPSARLTAKKTGDERRECKALATGIRSFLAARDGLGLDALAQLGDQFGESVWLFRLIPGNGRRNDLETLAAKAEEIAARKHKTGQKRSAGRAAAFWWAARAWREARRERPSFTTPTLGGHITGDFVIFVGAVFDAAGLALPTEREIKATVAEAKQGTN